MSYSRPCDLNWHFRKEVFSLNEHTLGQLLNELLAHSVIKKTSDGTLSFMVESVLLGNFMETKFE